MPRVKYDGVIEAIRYEAGGKIALARVYERHGAVWSDQILLGREKLVERLTQGKHFVTGQRKAYLGGVFEAGRAVRLVKDSLVTDGQSAGRDLLAGVPIF